MGLDVFLVGRGVVVSCVLTVTLLSIVAAILRAVANATGCDVAGRLVLATLPHPKLVLSNRLEFEQTEGVEAALVVASWSKYINNFNDLARSQSKWSFFPYCSGPK